MACSGCNKTKTSSKGISIKSTPKKPIKRMTNEAFTTVTPDGRELIIRRG